VNSSRPAVSHSAWLSRLWCAKQGLGFIFLGFCRDTHRELLPVGGLPLRLAEPLVVRRLHERVEAAHEVQLLLVQVLVGRRLCSTEWYRFRQIEAN
jgi:hypothetical protein